MMTAEPPESPVASSGRTVEGNLSLFGVGLFIVWLLVVALCLWQMRVRQHSESEAEYQQ